jgi:hypothetical protein
MNTLTQLDQKFHATDRAKAADQSYGITNRASSLFSGLSSYFEKASNTPTGKKLVKFYTESQRQVQDIHAEAQRLKELKKDEHGGSAYKASGLERVFGKEKEKADNASPESCEYMSCSQFLGPEVNERNEQLCNCAGSEERCLCTKSLCSCDGCYGVGDQRMVDQRKDGCPLTNGHKSGLFGCFDSHLPRGSGMSPMILLAITY